jgi:hypothetical protein
MRYWAAGLLAERRALACRPTADDWWWSAGKNPPSLRCLWAWFTWSTQLATTAKFLGARFVLVDEVFFLACATLPQTSFQDPVHDIWVNLPTSVRLFELAASLALGEYANMYYGSQLAHCVITPLQCPRRRPGFIATAIAPILDGRELSF